MTESYHSAERHPLHLSTSSVDRGFRGAETLRVGQLREHLVVELVRLGAYHQVAPPEDMRRHRVNPDRQGIAPVGVDQSLVATRGERSLKLRWVEPGTFDDARQLGDVVELP